MPKVRARWIDRNVLNKHSLIYFTLNDKRSTIIKPISIVTSFCKIPSKIFPYTWY